jgi:hypothetical protein
LQQLGRAFAKEAIHYHYNKKHNQPPEDGGCHNAHTIMRMETDRVET